MPRPSHGHLPSPSVEPATRSNLSRHLGDANLQDRGLGMGSAKSGTLAGKANAVWASVAIKPTTDLADIEVAHALGTVPVVCRLERVENPLYPNAAVSASPIRMSEWTRTTCRVAVGFGEGGGVAGATLTFYVGGE